MRVTFTTDAYVGITMFGDVALALLKMMGHSKTVCTRSNFSSRCSYGVEPIKSRYKRREFLATS